MITCGVASNVHPIYCVEEGIQEALDIGYISLRGSAVGSQTYATTFNARSIVNIVSLEQDRVLRIDDRVRDREVEVAFAASI